MENENILQMHAVFRGRVQGVGFRYTAKMLAHKTGLKGTVCNMPDGSVELYAQGKKVQLQNLLKDLETSFDLDIEQDCSIVISSCDHIYNDFSVIF